MKTSTMMWLGGAAVVGYYLYKQKVIEGAQAAQAQAVQAPPAPGQVVQSPPFAAPTPMPPVQAVQSPPFAPPPPAAPVPAAAVTPDGGVAAFQVPAPTVVVVQPDDSTYDYSAGPGPWGPMWGSLVTGGRRRGGGHGHGGHGGHH